MKTCTSRRRVHLRTPALALLALASALVVLPSSVGRAGTPSGYSIDVQRISAGGRAQRNACYRLVGSVGQPAPGYSSGSTLSVHAGFWPAVATDHPDQLFFSGFEGC